MVMVNTTKNTPTKNSSKVPAKTPVVQHHRVRTFFASIAGAIAVYLILASVTVVWLNRTLTDTNTFVATVGPLASKPAVQNFVAEKVADQIVQNAPTQDLANQLLPASQIKGQTPDAIRRQLESVVQSSVRQIIASPSFQTLWENTNRSAHAALVSQLNNANVSSISLDLSPAINGVVTELKTTQLKPIAKAIKIKPDTGKLDIKSDKISRIHDYYQKFKEATLAIVALAALMVALTIWLSVHHGKTARRILMSTGVLAIVQGLALTAPSVVKLPGNDVAAQAAARAIAGSLLHNLQIASFAIGAVCIIAAVGSMLYVKYRH